MVLVGSSIVGDDEVGYDSNHYTKKNQLRNVQKTSNNFEVIRFFYLEPKII